jgi:WYL domain
MAKKPQLHTYSDIKSFERMMILIATLLENPGIGCPDEENISGHHNALEAVKIKFQELVIQLKFELSIDLPIPSIPTIRKDLETLRKYKILDNQMYRWGYYLHNAPMNQEELYIVFQSLTAAAEYQGNMKASQVYNKLLKRLKALNEDLKGELFYPVRQHVNRPIMFTNPEEMIEKQEYKNTLFHKLERVEAAIKKGCILELSRGIDPYGKQDLGMILLIHLQLIYHDIAWYLVFERYSDNLLFIERLDRFKDYCKLWDKSERGIAEQEKSLKKVHKLLNNGWGLYLGTTVKEQQDELEGNLDFQEVKVRFYPPIAQFILEGDRRHPKQKINPVKDRNNNNKLLYVDYTISLPERSLGEFLRWVFRFMNHAQILEPASLVEQHRLAAKELCDRYNFQSDIFPNK